MPVKLYTYIFNDAFRFLMYTKFIINRSVDQKVFNILFLILGDIGYYQSWILKIRVEWKSYTYVGHTSIENIGRYKTSLALSDKFQNKFQKIILLVSP